MLQNSLCRPLDIYLETLELYSSMKKPELALSFHIILFWCVALPTQIVGYLNYEDVNHVVRCLHVIERTHPLFVL